MASTLMELKSRELLPREDVDIEDALDPRDDLIQRLLEYKRFRDLSRRLDRYGQLRTRMLEANLPLPQELRAPEENRVELDLGGVEVWSLTAAFAKLLEETGNIEQKMHIGVERKNIRYYTGQVLDRVRHGGEVDFRSLFERGLGRYELIGVFIAVLEMMKQGFLRAHQGECFEDIVVVYKGPADLKPEEVTASAREDGDLPDEEFEGEDFEIEDLSGALVSADESPVDESPAEAPGELSSGEPSPFDPSSADSPPVGPSPPSGERSDMAADS